MLSEPFYLIILIEKKKLFDSFGLETSSRPAWVVSTQIHSTYTFETTQASLKTRDEYRVAKQCKNELS